MELPNLRILISGNLKRTTVPPWITKLQIPNRPSGVEVETERLTHVTALKFLSVEWSADFENFTKLTCLETLHVPKMQFPEDLDLRNLVNLRSFKLLPPPLESSRWLRWIQDEAKK
jgi:hypothetical protein